MLAFLKDEGEWNCTLNECLPGRRRLSQIKYEGKKKIINKSIAYPYYYKKDKSDKMI